jgi:hypothetical protein
MNINVNTLRLPEILPGEMMSTTDTAPEVGNLYESLQLYHYQREMLTENISAHPEKIQAAREAGLEAFPSLSPGEQIDLTNDQIVQAEKDIKIGRQDIYDKIVGKSELEVQRAYVSAAKEFYAVMRATDSLPQIGDRPGALNFLKKLDKARETIVETGRTLVGHYRESVAEMERTYVSERMTERFPKSSQGQFDVSSTTSQVNAPLPGSQPSQSINPPTAATTTRTSTYGGARVYAARPPTAAELAQSTAAPTRQNTTPLNQQPLNPPHGPPSQSIAHQNPGPSNQQATSYGPPKTPKVTQSKNRF